MGSGAAVFTEGLSRSYGSTPIFKDLSFNLTQGSSLVLVGASGCGKSTLLNILAGLDHNYGGNLVISPGEARRVLVMQEYNLFPWKTAWKNVELPLVLAHCPIRKRKLLVGRMLEELNLHHLAHRYPIQLSGGQIQRLALARALISQPDLVLLDEPFSSLDAITRDELQVFLADLWHRFGLSMIMVTHSIEEAVFLGSHILVLGNQPTRIVAEFDNPDCGQAEKRFKPDYFTMISAIRQKMEQFP